MGIKIDKYKGMGLSRSGIYKITNLVNKKIYIGSSTNIRKRFNKHISLLRKNTHKNPDLQLDFNIGEENSFKFDVLEFCDKESLLEREQYYINANDFNNLYNIKPKSDGSIMPQSIKDKLKGTKLGHENPNFGKRTVTSRVVTDEQIREIKMIFKTSNFRICDVARMFNISEKVVGSIKNNITWKDI